MASRIGSDLHRARTRREIELHEVEAATRIRARFLRAIENEEWDALPGGVYTRGFIRTYANFLSLDGNRLADDYRREVEGAQPEVAATARGSAAPRVSRGVPWAAVIAAVAVALAVAVAVFAIPGGGNGGGGGASPGPQDASRSSTGQGGEQATTTSPARKPPRGVSMRLTAKAEVWACVLDASGRRLVDGQILEAGAAAGPFRSGSFTLSLGNGEVTMLIDDREAAIPPTPSPVGYLVDSSGALTELSEAERPSCE